MFICAYFFAIPLYFISKISHILATIYLFINKKTGLTIKLISHFDKNSNNSLLNISKLSIEKKQLLEFKLVKLFAINILIILSLSLFGRFCRINKYYKKTEIPKQMMTDIETNGIVLVCPHMGVFMDKSCLNLLFDCEPLYVCQQQKPQWLHNFIYKNSNYIEFVTTDNNNFNKFIKCNNKIIALINDQLRKNMNNLTNNYLFLNCKRPFHTSHEIIAQMTRRKIWAKCNTYDFEKNEIMLEFKQINLIDKKTNITQQIADYYTEMIHKYPDNYVTYIMQSIIF